MSSLYICGEEKSSNLFWSKMRQIYLNKITRCVGMISSLFLHKHIFYQIFIFYEQNKKLIMLKYKQVRYSKSRITIFYGYSLMFFAFMLQYCRDLSKFPNYRTSTYSTFAIKTTCTVWIWLSLLKYITAKFISFNIYMF